MEDATQSSDDDCLTVHIPAGSMALDAEGGRLRQVMVDLVEPLPEAPEGYFVLAALDFDPDGATFSPPMEVSICYDPDEIPADMAEENLVVAILDEATGEWTFLKVTVDIDANLVIFSTSHLTVFGLLAAPAAPTPTPVPPTPTPTSTAKPPPKGGGLSTGAIVGIVIAVLLLLGIGAGLWMMQRRGMSFTELWQKIRDKCKELWDKLNK